MEKLKKEFLEELKKGCGSLWIYNNSSLIPKNVLADILFECITFIPKEDREALVEILEDRWELYEGEEN